MVRRKKDVWEEIRWLERGKDDWEERRLYSWRRRLDGGWLGVACLCRETIGMWRAHCTLHSLCQRPPEFLQFWLLSETTCVRIGLYLPLCPHPPFFICVLLLSTTFQALLNKTSNLSHLCCFICCFIFYC